MTRSVYVSSSFVPKITSRTTVTAEAMSAVRSAHQKLSTSIASVRERRRGEEHERIEDEDDQEAEDECQRQPDRGDERRDQRVQDGDDE